MSALAAGPSLSVPLDAVWNEYEVDGAPCPTVRALPAEAAAAHMKEGGADERPGGADGTPQGAACALRAYEARLWPPLRSTGFAEADDGGAGGLGLVEHADWFESDPRLAWCVRPPPPPRSRNRAARAA